MSSFSVPPLAGSVIFDISRWTQGIDRMFADGGRFEGMVEQHLDRPMQQMAGEAGRAAHAAGESLKGEIEHGVMGAGAALELLPPLVIEFIENPIVAAAAVVIEAMKKAFDFIKDGIKEVSSKPLEIGLSAEKAGVSVEFFSRLSEAAKTVNIDVGQLGNAFKLLQKNAVDAAAGVPEAAKAFNEVGISTDFLSKHLNDNEALWQAVQEHIGNLPTPAERARRAMEILGKQGSDMVPLLKMSADEIKHLGDVAERLGATEDAGSVEWAKKWKVMTVQIDEAWTGMKKRMLEPFMKAIGDDWETNFLPALLKVADAVGKLIPQALELMRRAFIAIEPVIDSFLAGLEAIAKVYDKLDEFFTGTNPHLGDAVHEARGGLKAVTVSLEHIHFNIDPKDAAKQIGDQLSPHVEKGVRDLKREMQLMETRKRVRRAMGGH